MEGLGTSLSNSKSWSRPFFSLKNVVSFIIGFLLTRRWKLVELFMTVVMYRSQQHGRRGERIDTGKPESGIVLTWHMGEIKLIAFSLGNRMWWFPLAFSPYGVQGKLVRFWFHCFGKVLFCIHTLEFCLC